MIDSNGKLTEEAQKYLTQEEIDLFNSTDMQSAGWFIEKHAAATRLIAAGIQRKALLDVESKGRKNTWIANGIAALALIALIAQTLLQAKDLV